MGSVQPLSMIEAHEEDEAKAFVAGHLKEILGEDFTFRAAGYMVALKIYVRPEELISGVRDDGTEYKLIRPMTHDTDRFHSCSALVVSIGPQAYRGKNADGTEKFPEGPWCKVGDWVTIPRFESFQVMYKGKFAMALIPDDKVLGIIVDPEDIAPAN